MRTSHRLHIDYYNLTAPRSLIAITVLLLAGSITLPFLLVVQHSTSSCLSSLTILAPTLLENQTRARLNSFYLSNDLDLHAFASKVLGCWAVILKAHWLSHRSSS